MIRKVLEHPRGVLIGGIVFCLLMFVLSAWKSDWTWFPRGGAVLGLAGFLISGREILLYRSPTPDRLERRILTTAASAVVRRGQFGTPVFHPSLGIKTGPSGFQPTMGMVSRDDEETIEEARKAKEAQIEAWENAEPLEELEALVPGDPGYTPRDTNQLTADELSMLRHAAIAGTIGTLIWAFGDLLG